MKRYDKTIEHEMRLFYESLNEKDRRRYAAVEALKLGHGGQVYIAEVLGCLITGGHVQIEQPPVWKNSMHTHGIGTQSQLFIQRKVAATTR